MAKQLNKPITVDLKFNIDSSSAKQQLVGLSQQINQLSASSIKLPLTNELKRAQMGAINLQTALKQAVNVDTGKFDLSKFSNSLKKSGTSLTDLRNRLQGFGVEGQKAFMSLAQSIAQAEVPTRRISARIQELGTVMKNTLKWQISSSALHALMGSMQQAYSYAKNLNRSLNDIRIVTGYSADKMKEFAEQANKAAKTLSASTLEYTKASLIYYQQGLDDQAVNDRTTTTVKMANVTGESADTVSQWMTSIWNNFDDGSKSLEYYADVITELGAATASSSEEIATGLEKFSAVADTVGLSYEYATSALATVTAQTRQSADVVGTAFKTLFARIQDLELGKTLDDGTSLGSYSEALNAVGVNIKDSNGELKDMDIILDEMGSKWQTIDKAQQVALAKSVAGVRQYTQLIALMDNYDTFKSNVDIAQGAEGTLQEQQDIYAESWEAAQKRVQAAAQTIYQSLLDDEFFIKLTDSLADLLGFVDQLIQSAGGLKGILFGLSGIILKIFSKQIATGLENMVYNVRQLTGYGQQADTKLKDLAIKLATDNKSKKRLAGTSESDQASVKVMSNQMKLQNEMTVNLDKMSVEERERCKIILEENKAYGDQLVLTKKQAEEAEKAYDKIVLQNNIKARANSKKEGGKDYEVYRDQMVSSQAVIDRGRKAQETFENRLSESEEQFKDKDAVMDKTFLANTKSSVTKQKNEFAELGFGPDSAAVAGLNAFGKVLEKKNLTVKEFNEALEKLIQDSGLIGDAMAEAQMKLQENNFLKENEAREMTEAYLNQAEAHDKVKIANDNYNNSLKRSKEILSQAKVAMKSWGETVVSLASGISSMVFALQSLIGIKDILSNDDLSTGEKILQVITALTMGITMLGSAMKSFQGLQLKSIGASMVETLGRIAGAQAARKAAQEERRLAEAKDKTNDETEKNIVTEEVESKNRDRHAAKSKKRRKKGKKGPSLNLKDPTVTDPKKSETIFTKFSKRFTMGFGQGKYGETPIQENGGGWKLPDGANKGQFAKGANLSGEAIKGLGSSLAGIGIIIAGIAVAVGSVALLIKFLNKDVDNLKKATERAKQANEMYQESVNKYNSLKDNTKKYQDDITNLNKLTKGTLEWREAIYKTNESAMKLLDTYEDLKYTVDKNGVIQIDQKSLEAAQGQQLSRMLKAQRFAADSDIEKNKAANVAATTKFNRKYATNHAVTDEDWAIAGTGLGVGVGSGAAIGAGIGMAAGTVVPVIGNIVGVAAGAIIGGLIGAATGLIGGTTIAAVVNDQTKQEKSAIEKLTEEYKVHGNSVLTKEGIADALKGYDKELVKSLVDNVEETRKLIKSIDKNTEINRIKERQSTMSYLESNLQGADKEAYLDFEHKEQIADMMNYSDEFKEAEEKAKKQIEDATGWTNDIEMHKAYAEYMGWDLDESQIKDDAGKAVFTFADGTKKTLDDEMMKGQLAKEYAREMAAKNYLNYKAQIDYTQELGNYFGSQQGLNRQESEQVGNMLVEGSIATATAEQVQAIQATINDAKNNGTLLVSEEQAKAMGYKSAEAYLEAMQTQIDEYDEDKARVARQNKETQEYQQALKAGADQTGKNKTALEGYSNALLKNYKALEDNKEMAVKCAVANVQFADGVYDLDKALTEGLDVLTEWNEGSIQTYEAAGKVQEALKKMFNVDVSADFVHENLEEIQKITNGDVSNLEELEGKASKDFVKHLNIGDEAKTVLNGLSDELQKAAPELEVGGELDLGNYAEKLNDLLQKGEITKDQLTQIFNGFGFEPEIGWKTVQGKEETVTDYKIKIGGFELSNVEVSSKPSIQVPYIKSSKTGNKDEGTKAGSSGTKERSKSSVAAALGDLAKKKEKDAQKNVKSLEEELERYHEIREILADIERELDDISKAKDRAYGRSKIKLMNEEISKQKELLSAEQAYLAEMKEYYKLDKSKLSKYGAKFDDHGRIANHQDLFIQQINAYNAIGEKTGWKGDVFEAASKNFEQFKKDMSQYEETLNLIEEQESKIIDKRNEIFDAHLDKIDYIANIKIEVESNDLQYLDYLLEKVKDDAFAAAESLDLLGKKTAHILSQTNAEEERIRRNLQMTMTEEDIDALISGDYSVIDKYELTDKQTDMLKSSRDALYEYNKQLLELRDTMFETMEKGFDAWNEKLEENAKKLNHSSKMLTHFKNIIDTIGADNLGVSSEIINNLAEAQVTNANAVLKTSQDQLDAVQHELENAKQGLAEAQSRGDEASIKKWEDYIKHVSDKMTELKEKVADDWKAALDAAAEAFKTATDTAFKDFEKMLSGPFKTLDALTAAFDKQKEIQERFLPGYEKIYELSKLNRNIQKSIDTTDSIKGQKILKELQDEVLANKDANVKLSKYDLEYLQKKYDLRLAEIALEEAQNAKSQVRLTRDSEGNWGYQYITDQVATEDAAQNYEDKLFAMQQFNQQYIAQIEEQIAGLGKQMEEELQKLDVNSADYAEKANKIVDFYTTKMHYLTDELDTAVNNSADEYERAADRKYTVNDGLVISFDQTRLAILGNFEDVDTYRQQFVEATGSPEQPDTLLGSLYQGYLSYQEELGHLMENMGTSMSDFKNKAKEELTQAKDSIGKVVDASENLKNDMKTNLDIVNSNLVTWETQYSATIGKAIKKNEDFVKSINAVLKILGLATEEEETKDPGPSGTTDYTKGATERAKGYTDYTKGATERAKGYEDATIPLKKPSAEEKNDYFKKPDPIKDAEKDKNIEFKVGMAKFEGDLEYPGLMDADFSQKYNPKSKDKSLGTYNKHDLKAALQSAKLIGYKVDRDTKYGSNPMVWYVFDGTIFTGKTGINYNAISQQDLQTFIKDITPNNLIKALSEKGFSINENSEGGYVVDENDWEKTSVVLSNLYKFDTGGYTGAWGPEGRMAMLHQKELVLNAHDTENFLTAIEIVRGIADKIEAQAKYANQLDGLNNYYQIKAKQQDLNQNVTIHAEFPNVTDHNEIEEAFNNLNNLASQYIRRY